MLKEKIKYTDTELISLFNSERKEFAFNLIIKKYQERLYWHIRKIVISHDDSDDILQNTLVKVWKGLEGFRSDAQLYTWLYRIATNESLSFLKSKKRRTTIAIENDEYDLSETLMSDEYFCGNEAQQKLQAALLQLPEKQRLVFNMKYFDDLKYQEIADILDTSVGTLKASYHHAVKKIEKFLSVG
jgi:RNA polymerase sigma-70 factor (ECF subfamily)